MKYAAEHCQHLTRRPGNRRDLASWLRSVSHWVPAFAETTGS
jgi:hypothetical protein